MVVTVNLSCTQQKDWAAWCASGQRHPLVPINPGVTYNQRGWKSWKDFLGIYETQNVMETRVARALVIEEQGYMSFKEAQFLVRSMKLRSREAWEEWCAQGYCPQEIPFNPALVYKGDGWRSWWHWLGCTKADLEGREKKRKGRPSNSSRVALAGDH